MKKVIIRIGIGLLIVFALFIGLFIVPYFANIVMPWDKAVAIEAALDWGGLAELPKEAENLKVETEGSMFTRTFIIEFEANQKEIENWILNSKRLRDNNPTLDGQIKTYEIYPGENESIGGKVMIDKEKVTIKMSWS